MYMGYSSLYIYIVVYISVCYITGGCLRLCAGGGRVMYMG